MQTFSSPWKLIKSKSFLYYPVVALIRTDVPWYNLQTIKRRRSFIIHCRSFIIHRRSFNFTRDFVTFYPAPHNLLAGTSLYSCQESARVTSGSLHVLPRGACTCYLEGSANTPTSVAKGAFPLACRRHITLGLFQRHFPAVPMASTKCSDDTLLPQSIIGTIVKCRYYNRKERLDCVPHFVPLGRRTTRRWRCFQDSDFIDEANKKLFWPVP